MWLDVPLKCQATVISSKNDFVYGLALKQPILVGFSEKGIQIFEILTKNVYSIEPMTSFLFISDLFQ